MREGTEVALAQAIEKDYVNKDEDI